jgi:hypothetical protein
LFRDKTFFEAQPKHVVPGLGVQPHEEETEGFGGGVLVQFHDFVFRVNAGELLANGLNLPVVAQSPNRETPDVFSDH